ncbi:hypothetical protein LUZ60_005805 [Juncus effusus]|nr:hypothetical protein LUZ60_005805 [Juncus effusus]
MEEYSIQIGPKSPKEEGLELQKKLILQTTPKTAQIRLVSSHPEVYAPCDDSFLLVDSLLADRQTLIHQNPNFCLEIGCGSGYVITSLALILSPFCPSAQFFATDINPNATQTTFQTLKNHDVNCEVLATDLASCLKKRLYKTIDLLVINPPYVPTPDSEVGIEGIVSSWAGGINGRKVINRILNEIDDLLSCNGSVYMVVLSENDPFEISRVMRERGFESRIVLQRSTEEERLCVIKFWRERGERERGGERKGEREERDGWFNRVSSLLKGGGSGN